MKESQSEIKKTKRVFLGGTCNGSTWREELIEMLEIEYFNPIVADWTPSCQEEEIRQRELCDYCLYVITPQMTGVYSIAEVVDDSNKKPDRTLFCVLLGDDEEKSFSSSQCKSLMMVGRMIERNGGKHFISLEDVAEYLNNL